MKTGWWASDNDERYKIGPCATRQEAIDEAISQGIFTELDPEPPEHPNWRIAIHVVEADSPDMIDVSINYYRAARLLEDMEENEYEMWLDPDSDGLFADVTTAQKTDLAERLTKSFREWVTEHGLTLRYSAFQNTRNAEVVYLPHPSNGKVDDVVA